MNQNNIQICYKCKRELDLTSFWKDKRSASGHCRECKDCFKSYRSTSEWKEWRKKYDSSEAQKQYHINYEKNQRVRDKIKTTEQRRACENNKRKTNPLFKLKQNYSRHIRLYLNKGYKQTIDFLGCSITELKNYLEPKFKPGMTWENYGLYGWHIDHIIPLASGKTEEEITKLFHYTNLQPLWATENRKKGCKIL